MLLVKTLLLLCISPKKSKLRRGKGVQRFSARYFGVAPFLCPKQNSQRNPWLLRFKIGFVKEWRIEEIRNTDIKALTYFVNQAEFDRIIRAIHDVSNRGFRHAAFHIQLILRHIAFFQKFLQPCADSFV